MFSSISPVIRLNCSNKCSVRWLYKRRQKAWTMTMDDFLKEKQDLPIFQFKSEEKSQLHDRIFTWGFGKTGALGIPSFTGDSKKTICATPRKLSIFGSCKVKDIACGHGFTVFAAEAQSCQTQLFGCGVNTDNQIGYHLMSCKELVLITKPAAINFPANTVDLKVKQVACGRAHTIVLMNNNNLYSFGNNSYGQCGVPIKDKTRNRFSHINEIKGIPGQVEKVVCGQDHTLFLLKSGEVYACGWSADGQTGTGYRSVSTPTKVCGDIEGEKIVEISSFADGTLACSDKGDLFCWGSSEYAQFRLITDDYQVNVPKRLPVSVGKVVKVAAGGSICGLINDKGQVYVWGFGLLGQGPNVHDSSIPLLLPEPLFGCNDVNPDIKVISLVAGFSRWAAINSNGDLFCWGKNRSGCLGFKDKNDRYFPMRINLPVNVRKVCLGPDHTAIIGRTII
ncbi:RCC1-like G exchanging factor-like protein [Panonychus citri]|uniref:RCC1-like G exchanging factor-like protein n=1 Tax=Panonychus citri TaxID=50023 RepID=UPI002306F4D5|nr:RCC1-like G exchanging factor-like protein [Panonychus citri]